MGISVLPPDVNESGLRFTPVPSGIRYGMAGVKGVGAAAVEAIIAERTKNGPYKGFVDFFERTSVAGAVNKKAVESLIKAGAFDFTGLSRGRLFAGIEPAASYAASVKRDRAAGQTSLFDMLAPDDAKASGLGMTDSDLPDAPPWSRKDMLAFEKELIGFYISGHPLQDHLETLSIYSQTTAADFQGLDERVRVRVGGLLTQERLVRTKPKEGSDEKPKPMLFFQIETPDGFIPAAAYTKAYEENSALLQPETVLFFCGSVRLDRTGAGKMLSIDEVYPVDTAPSKFTQSIRLDIKKDTWTEERLQHLADVLRRHPGRTLVTLCLRMGDGDVYLRPNASEFSINVTEDLIRDCRTWADAVHITPSAQPGLRTPEEPRWKKKQ